MERAVRIAKADAGPRKRPIILAPVARYRDRWTTPVAIDPFSITWRRCLDMNDRSLRRVMVGLGGKVNGIPRETGFDITPASEVMAIPLVGTSRFPAAATSIGSPYRVRKLNRFIVAKTGPGARSAPAPLGWRGQARRQRGFLLRRRPVCR